MRVQISRIDLRLPLPRHATSGSVGFDLVTRVTTTVEPGQIARIPSNVIIATPPGFMLLLAVRSSTPRRTGLRLANGVGIVDQDYQGPEDEIQVDVWNPTDSPVVVERGDRIAQAILVKIERAEWEELDTVDAPTRGGFGSTG